MSVQFFLQCRVFTEHLAAKTQSLLLSIKLLPPAQKFSGCFRRTPRGRPRPTRLESSSRFHSKEHRAEPGPGEAASPSGRTGGRPSQPPASKNWDRRPHVVHFGRIRIKENSSGPEKDPGSTSGPGTGVWREGCRGGRPGAIPSSPAGSQGREARTDCQSPAWDWALGSERPHRSALRREVPSHRP